MPATDYDRVEQIIRYLEANFQSQPTLEELGRVCHLSPPHLQRLFRRWAGVSPKRFLQFLTVEHAKRVLAESRGVLGASLDSGLSGPGRLHDLFVAAEGLTPGEYADGGRGVTVRYGRADSPFGRCLIAATGRGLCLLEFTEDFNEIAGWLRRHFPQADIVEDQETAADWAGRVFNGRQAERIPLDVHGTNFQIRVWRALLEIPPGHVWSYGDVARRIDAPKASRAVGRAVGQNPICYLIPCHRVIRGMGVFHGYRWGTARKRALLAWEAARSEAGRSELDGPASPGRP
jgi:AraC family transcriptional regulator of adaptative response/methylated-DNA-[protein]-cysteine methyltransferase